MLASDRFASTGSSHALDAGARRGALVRIRHGAYATVDEWGAVDPGTRMLAAIDATRSAARTGEPVFAYESAAAKHGIPLIGAWPSRAHVITAHGGATSNASVIRTRRMTPRESLVVLGDGAVVTSLITTAIDLAATRTPLGGIVAFDHLRFHHGVDIDEIMAELRRRRPFPGVRQAETAARRSTARSATPAESLAVTRIRDLGYAKPVQQFGVTDIDGNDYEVDLSWRGGRILAEIDGRSKYEIAAAERGVTVTDRLWAEKHREDAIRPTCDRFFRAVWNDLWLGHVFDRALTAAGVPRIARRRALTF